MLKRVSVKKVTYYTYKEALVEVPNDSQNHIRTDLPCALVLNGTEKYH